MCYFQDYSPSYAERNAYMLEILEKKPGESFKKFKDSLIETGQGFLVAELLSHVGETG